MGAEERQKAADTAADCVAEVQAETPQCDETARQRVALLTGKAELDAREAKYRQLVAKYGGNRWARRRARAEVRKKKDA